MKAKTRNTILIVGLVAVMVVLIALVARLYGVGDKKIASPDNLVSIDAIGKANYATQTGNTGYGIEVSVNELGAIRMTGKATSDLTYTVGTVTLAPGRTYTLSGAPSGSSFTGYALRLRDVNGGQYVYAEINEENGLSTNGTFTVPSESSQFVLEIVVKDETNFGVIGKTFKPVLVEGTKAGTFSAVAE